jgi:DtxR family Mn-dependent transcriptional regulator
LAEELGMPWDQVHKEAEVLEHVLSEDVEQLIAEKLGHPTHDPHGDPIPTPDGEIYEPDTLALDELEAGDAAVFVRVSDQHPDMLRYLSERGIAPGVRVEVLGREPFGGPLRVRVKGREHPLGAELARAMRVESA